MTYNTEKEQVGKEGRISRPSFSNLLLSSNSGYTPADSNPYYDLARRQTVDFSLQPYDVLMLAVLAVSTMFGAFKGVAWQVASLGSLVASVLVARHFSGPLAPHFGDSGPWNRCIAMLVLYVVTSLVIWTLFQVVAGIVDRMKMKEFDRQIGALFGAVKGVLWCLLITFFAVTISAPARQKVLDSHSGFYAAVLIHRAKPVLPPKVRDVLGGYLDEFERRLDPTTLPRRSSDLAARDKR